MLLPGQVMSLEEVERILDETQEAVEYQRVGAHTVPQPAGGRQPPPRVQGTMSPSSPSGPPLPAQPSCALHLSSSFRSK